MLELFYNVADYQLWCIAIGVLTVLFVYSTFSILRWQFLFNTKAVAWEELKKTFETEGYSLSETATYKKKGYRWVITDEGNFFSRKIYIIKKEGDNLTIYKDELLSNIKDDLSSKFKRDFKELIGSIDLIKVTLFLVVFCVLFFGVLNKPVDLVTLWHNAENYQRWCFATVIMVYAIFFIPFYLLGRDSLHLRIWANISILLLTIFVALFSLCKCWNCFFSEDGAFLWVFSTLAQVYGALLALLVLSVFFISEHSNIIFFNNTHSRKEDKSKYVLKNLMQKNMWDLYSPSATIVSLKCLASVLIYSIIILPARNFFSAHSGIGVITVIIFGVVFPIFAICSLIPLIKPILTLIKSGGTQYNKNKNDWR
jgi:hypothetical protein